MILVCISCGFTSHRDNFRDVKPGSVSGLNVHWAISQHRDKQCPKCPIGDGLIIKDRFSKKTIMAFRKHLNETIGFCNDYVSKGKTGATKRLYGDYLYAQDREMFMADLLEAVESGNFKEVNE